MFPIESAGRANVVDDTLIMGSIYGYYERISSYLCPYGDFMEMVPVFDVHLSPVSKNVCIGGVLFEKGNFTDRVSQAGEILEILYRAVACP